MMRWKNEILCAECVKCDAHCADVGGTIKHELANFY